MSDVRELDGHQGMKQLKFKFNGIDNNLPTWVGEERFSKACNKIAQILYEDLVYPEEEIELMVSSIFHSPLRALMEKEAVYLPVAKKESSGS